MANPIVVFVVPDQFGIVLTDTMTGAAGVTECGQLEEAQPENRYALLFLDDTQDVPTNVPCRIDNTQPLIIVAHNRSERNRGPWNEGLWGNTHAIICKRFSHTGDDPVFDSVRRMLNGENAQEAIADFVRSCEAMAALEVLDGLAAIAQIRMLCGDNNLQDVFGEDLETLRQLRERCLFASPIDNRDEFRVSNAECQIKTVRHFASQLVNDA